MYYLSGFVKRSLKLIFIIFAALSFLISCNEDNGVSPSDNTLLSTTEDAAEAIASDIAKETGGVTDQMDYLSELASVDGMQNPSLSLAKSSGTDQITSYDTVYNDDTGKWTITINYTRQIPERDFFAEFYRVYSVQFLYNGMPQKYYITNSDTAETINFDIVEGIGNIQSPRLTHKLKTLSGSWVATNANEKFMGVAGTYSRAAVDTFSTRNAVRTLDYSFTTTFAGIMVPTNNSGEVTTLITGGISGNFKADISITKGEQYFEESVERTFAIVFAISVFEININDDIYNADTQTGELIY